MKVLKDYMEMGKIVAKQFTEHQDIIQVYDYKAVEKVEKRLIHQMLKGKKGALDKLKGITTHLKSLKCVKNVEHS